MENTDILPGTYFSGSAAVKSQSSSCKWLKQKKVRKNDYWSHFSLIEGDILTMAIINTVI